MDNGAAQRIRTPQQFGSLADIAHSDQFAYFGGGDKAAFIAEGRDDLYFVIQLLPNFAQPSRIAFAASAQGKVIADEQALQAESSLQPGHEIVGGETRQFRGETLGDDHVHAEGKKQVGALIGSRQAFDLAPAQDVGWMRLKGEHNGRRAVGVSACREGFEDLLVSAMNAIEDTDRQPGILQ